MDSGLIQKITSFTYSVCQDPIPSISLSSSVYPLVSITRNLSLSRRIIARFSRIASGIDFIFRYHLLSCIKDVYIHCRGTNNLSDLVCRILLRLTATSRFDFFSFLLEENCESMFKEGGIGLLFAVAKSCVGNEETIRMCMQVLRVIAFMGSSFSICLSIRRRSLAAARAKPLSSHGNGVQIAPTLVVRAASQSLLHDLRSEIAWYASLLAFICFSDRFG